MLVAALVAPGYVLVAPWALAKSAVDALTEKDARRQLAQQRADPNRIPPAIAQSIAERSEFTADTLEQLLETTGLVFYQQDVPILSFGTLEQDLWVYYRSDAALNARFDPVARRIIGPIRNLLADQKDAESYKGHTLIACPS
ncbi:MAG: hypothetical protein H0W78_08760 [Planctomycetes bacterium]|nr:hypothetical protein [Planctomycetota bacterium]